jgi:hypothetical protein
LIFSIINVETPEPRAHSAEQVLNGYPPPEFPNHATAEDQIGAGSYELQIPVIY